MKRICSALLAVLLTLAVLTSLASCRKNRTVNAKIGVIRGDASSVEALAWEAYLRNLSGKMGVKIDFSTAIESADDELTAIQNYGSQGYNGIIAMTSYNPTSLLEKSQQYGMYLVIAATHPDFEDSDHSLVKDPNVVIRDYANYPYYVGATGPSHYGEVLAGYEMGKAGVAAGYRTYSVFTGSAAFGQMMHALRIAGWFAALYEDDPSVTYNGVSCSLQNWKTVTAQLQKDFGVNLSSFRSDKYRIVAQAGGYAFLQGDATAKAAVSNLTAARGVECVICTGISDAISNLEPNGANIRYIGNDALGSSFETMFREGKLIFDIAKYNSYIGPAFALLLKSIYDGQAVRIDGNPVSIEQTSLSITKADDYATINAVETASGGYFFSAEFLSAFILGTDLGDQSVTVERFAEICSGKATLDEGGLYETTLAVSRAYTDAGHATFVFGGEAAE